MEGLLIVYWVFGGVVCWVTAGVIVNLMLGGDDGPPDEV